MLGLGVLVVRDQQSCLSRVRSPEPPYGVLGSRENGGQNKQGAGSRVVKSLGSRERRK